MRWQALFDDLEAQLDAAEAAELAAEVAERQRIEVGRLRLADRLAPAVGSSLVVAVEGLGALHGVLADAGVDWLLLDEPGGREALVPSTSLLSVVGLSRAVAVTDPGSRLARSLDLRRALRGLVRDRAPVQVVLRDATTVAGTLDRVGADHVDVAEHPAGELRRPGAVRSVRVVPLAAVAVVRSG